MPREPDQGYPERVRELNGRIRALAAGDRRVTIVDTYTPLALPDGSSRPECFQPDRLHLNEAGYVVWRDVLRPVVAGWKLK
jgi:lysophospholipase L1-like esterase